MIRKTLMLGLVATALGSSATGAWAASFTVIDPWGQSPCPAGVTTGCDVVGSLGQGDFYRADLNFGPTNGTMNLYFNYGPPGQTNLAPYAVTANTTLAVADVFLVSGASIYAIPLFNRTTSSWGSATAGTIYNASSAAALLSSATVLGANPDIDTRPGETVWIDTGLATIGSVGSINVLTNQVIDGIATRFSVTINLSYSAGSALANALSGPDLGFYFATNTAGADVAATTVVPLPATGLLLGAALAALGGRAVSRRSRKHAH